MLVDIVVAVLKDMQNILDAQKYIHSNHTQNYLINVKQ